MTYVRNAWYVAAWAEEIVAERPTAVHVLNEPIVIWRNAAGEVAAFEDRCIHRLAPLSLGRCEGKRLRCMYHGLLYDGEGRVVEIPGQDRVPNHLRVRVYPAIERHRWLWVWMGDVEAADEALIPPVTGFDNSDYLLFTGQLDYAAEARLVNDNLLDLSHVSFLHAESFRMGEIWARERPKVVERERSVCIDRWIRSEGNGGALDTQERVDTYFWHEHFVPGILQMIVRLYPVGTAASLNGRQPDLSQVVDNFAIEAVTPLTDKSTRYFYLMGMNRRTYDEAARDANMSTVRRGFQEDKVMIEAQQRNIDTSPDRRFKVTPADQGALVFQQIIEKIARQEPTHNSATRSSGSRSGVE